MARSHDSIWPRRTPLLMGTMKSARRTMLHGGWSVLLVTFKTSLHAATCWALAKAAAAEALFIERGQAWFRGYTLLSPRELVLSNHKYKKTICCFVYHGGTHLEKTASCSCQPFIDIIATSLLQASAGLQSIVVVAANARP